MDSSFFLTTVAAAIGIFTLLRKLSFHQDSKKKNSSTLSPSSPPSLASSSSSPLVVLSPFSRNYMHHVFPSFHGADIRKSFLSHILKEFRSKGINPFIDDDIERSKSIGPELIEAIRRSRILIVLLSKNYASSTWCMNELVEIMKCRQELHQIVMTIFYEVDPTDVKKQTRDFGEVFRKTCKGQSKEEIRRWRQALTEVATIAGYHSNNRDNEADMIEDIVTDVSNKLINATPSRDFDHLIGMGGHMEKIERIFLPELNEVRMIGIWGPSGIGKTTIARFLFKKHSKSFQLSVFMENIKERYAIPVRSDDYGVKLYLQEQIMSQIINQVGIKIPHLETAKDRLKDKKVLVVLDDVDQLVQLEAMAKETCWFGPWSRIIITTQDRKLLRARGINHIYKVDFPSTDEALQMFCMYAFGQKSPKDGFKELAWEVTYLAGNLPLGLQVMGSYFQGMSKHEWSMELPRLRTSLTVKIESILKFGYDALCDEDKKLFLHIACLFHYTEFEKVVEYLARSFSNVRQGLHVLAEKSLIYIEHGYIRMHSLLAQLGNEIVRARELGKRQFLVNTKDFSEVLTDYTMGSNNIIGIDSWVEDELNISERAFEGMSNLQFLIITGDFPQNILPGRLKYISPKLRLLHWEYFPMTCLSIFVNPEFLVELSMSHSKLEKLWEEIKPLQNLKWMDLSYSVNLKELPNISTATNLKKLNLSHCSSLVELPSSIGNLHRLTWLNLKGCPKLEILPTNINLESLTELVLTGCSRLKIFPEISTSIERLFLIGTSIEEVPSSISLWSGLKELHMSYSESLQEFPHALESITELHLTNTKIQELGPWVERISHLRRLVLNRMHNLTSLPRLPDSLKFLQAENCESLERLDWSFCNPYIWLNFVNCFKLNQEARNFIIRTTNGTVAVFPSGEVHECFTYRASGSSITVKLDEKPLRTSTRFKACILLDNKGKYEVHGWEDLWVSCSITSKHNVLTTCRSGAHFLCPIITEHMYTFEVEAQEVTSTELLFEFKLTGLFTPTWEVKECGTLQILKLDVYEHY